MDTDPRLDESPTRIQDPLPRPTARLTHQPRLHRKSDALAVNGGGGSGGAWRRLPVFWRLPLLVSAFVRCCASAVIVLSTRRERTKDLEILVPRHELSILRCQVGKPRFELHDR